jgi:phage terminase large subunit
VTLAAVDKCIASPPDYRRGDRVAFCDFAGGGDENVLAIREGNRVRIVRAWREANEMAAIGEFIQLFQREGLKAEEIYGDNCGAGKPMIARFHEVGWFINRFNAGESAFNDREFINRGAEVWEMAGREIGKGAVIIPDDSATRAQLVSRKRLVDSKGRFKCEAKDDMRKRGVKSPDRADAVTAVIALREVRPINGKADINPPWMQYLSEQAEAEFYEESGSLVGANAGG